MPYISAQRHSRCGRPFGAAFATFEASIILIRNSEVTLIHVFSTRHVELCQAPKRPLRHVGPEYRWSPITLDRHSIYHSLFFFWSYIRWWVRFFFGTGLPPTFHVPGPVVVVGRLWWPP